MSKNYKNLAIFVALLSILSLTNLVWGQNPPIENPITQSQIVTGQSLRDVIFTLFRWAFLILTWVAGALAVLYIIWGGINVIIQAKIDEGKQRLIYGAVGLVIALIAYALVKLIETIITTGGIGQ